jgi:SET domain-containing protein
VNVYIRDTGTARGRGVFAARPFADGETIEECPVILLTGRFASIPDEVRKILFDWGELAAVPHVHCLALGYGSLYNHRNAANLRYVADVEAKVLRFIALRAIAPDEELTINYNDASGSHAADAGRNWFTRMGLAQLDH